MQAVKLFSLTIREEGAAAVNYLATRRINLLEFSKQKLALLVRFGESVSAPVCQQLAKANHIRDPLVPKESLNRDHRLNELQHIVRASVAIKQPLRASTQA